MLARLMLMTTLAKITSSADKYRFDYNHPAWGNLWLLLGVVEKFVFYMPTEAGLCFIDSFSPLMTHHQMRRLYQLHFLMLLFLFSGLSEEAESKEACGIHLDKDGFILDLPLVERCIDLLSRVLKVRKRTILPPILSFDKFQSACRMLCLCFLSLDFFSFAL